jgi:IS30 family transposase
MKHLTEEKRNQLEILLVAGKKQGEIARLLGCNQSTVSRELRRNSSARTNLYRGHRGQQRAVKRRGKSYQGRRWYEDEDLYQYVFSELEDGKSPEQVSGRMRHDRKAKTISFQSIYTYLRKDRYQGGKLYKLLRYQGRKYKWRGFGKEDKSRIINRQGIEKRPPVVQAKKRVGDWESDLVVSGVDGKGAVATFVERKSLYFQADLVADKGKAEMLRATHQTLGRFPRKLRQTMTHDNGREINCHETITKQLGMKVYCARPYCSCDRGLNEWMNRELRRFFPKGTDFSKVSPITLANAVNWLNNCPRRSLGFQTPREVFSLLCISS